MVGSTEKVEDGDEAIENTSRVAVQEASADIEKAVTRALLVANRSDSILAAIVGARYEQCRNEGTDTETIGNGVIVPNDWTSFKHSFMR